MQPDINRFEILIADAAVVDPPIDVADIAHAQRFELLAPLADDA